MCHFAVTRNCYMLIACCHDSDDLILFPRLTRHNLIFDICPADITIEDWQWIADCCQHISGVMSTGTLAVKSWKMVCLISSHCIPVEITVQCLLEPHSWHTTSPDPAHDHDTHHATDLHHTMFLHPLLIIMFRRATHTHSQAAHKKLSRIESTRHMKATAVKHAVLFEWAYLKYWSLFSQVSVCLLD